METKALLPKTDVKIIEIKMFVKLSESLICYFSNLQTCFLKIWETH